MPGFAGRPASARRPHRRFRATKHIIPQSSEIAIGVQLYHVEKQTFLLDGAQEKSAKNVFRSKIGVFRRRTKCNNNTFFGRIWNPPLRPYITKNPRTFVRGFWCGYGIFPRADKLSAGQFVPVLRHRRPVQILFTARPTKKLQA